MVFKKTLFICALMLLVAGCGENTKKPEANNNSEPTSSVGAKKDKMELDAFLIASIPEEKIYLYALNLNKKDNMYKDLILSVNGVKRAFDWETLSLIQRLPELHYLDLNGDNKKELAIKLFENYGTGISLNTMHIINPENLTEYKVENPLKIIEDNVEIKILSPKEAEIEINSNISNINVSNIPDELLGVYPDTISEIYYKDYIDYEIENNTLKVYVGAEADPLKYIGNIVIDYSFKNEEFKANKIYFDDFLS